MFILLTSTQKKTNKVSISLISLMIILLLCSNSLSADQELKNNCLKGTCVECEKSDDLPNTNICKMCINSYTVAFANGVTKCSKDDMPANCILPMQSKGSDYIGCNICAVGYKPVVGAAVDGKKPITCESGELIENCILAQGGSSPKRVLETRTLITSPETECVYCKEGMYLNSGTCTTVPTESVIPNCQYYKTLTNCAACKEGFAVNSSDNEKCVANTENCGTVESGKCTKCSILQNFYAVGIKDDGNVICEAYSRIISYTIGALFIWIATMI